MRLFGRAVLPRDVLVVSRLDPRPLGSPSAPVRSLLQAVERHASDLLGAPPLVVAVDVRRARVERLSDGARVALRDLARDGRLFFNASFLLSDAPPVAALRAVAAGRLACCGSSAGGDLRAFACGEALGKERLRAWLGALATSADAPADPWPVDPRAEWIEADAVQPERSPSVRGTPLVSVRAGAEAPRWLNTALGEMLAASAAPGTSLPDDLARLRDASRVPWIFNSLLNEIELREGTAEPRALPPEVHLSLTGVCNIECRFCGYTHETARFNRVTLEQVQSLAFLRSVRTLRLNSGLGEPTADPHLPAIVEWLAGRFPHIALNFFTNGVNLHGRKLLDAIVGRVRWISVSLNAATAETWREVCGTDFFARVLTNLRDLQEAKRAAGTPFPLVFGSMVLQGANLDDLPRMPALCRAHGVDRFSGFPYFGLGYRTPLKYGPEQTLAAVRARYDALYEETIREAAAHEVSIELPLPEPEKSVSFGLERRGLHDFACVETNERPLDRFLVGVTPVPERSHCHFLWRQAAIGSTYHGQAQEQTHYLYPCLGPLSSVDLSRRTAFRFDQAGAFAELWRNDVFTLLRRAQRQPGMVPVCDACRSTDTRDPAHFERLDALVKAFKAEHSA